MKRLYAAVTVVCFKLNLEGYRDAVNEAYAYNAAIDILEACASELLTSLTSMSQPDYRFPSGKFEDGCAVIDEMSLGEEWLSNAASYLGDQGRYQEFRDTFRSWRALEC